MIKSLFSVRRDDAKTALISSFSGVETLVGSIHHVAGQLGTPSLSRPAPFPRCWKPHPTALSGLDEVSIKNFFTRKRFWLEG